MRGRFVYHLACGIAMRPDTTGMDERLVAARECLKHGIDGRAVYIRVVCGGQADDAVAVPRRGTDVGRVDKIAGDWLDAGGSQPSGRVKTRMSLSPVEDNIPGLMVSRQLPRYVV
jgi:hypothetical protein